MNKTYNRILDLMVNEEGVRRKGRLPGYEDSYISPSGKRVPVKDPRVRPKGKKTSEDPPKVVKRKDSEGKP